MAREEYIREFPSQKIIGIVKTESNGDKLVMEFPSRRILGYYRARGDVTTDFYGRIIAKGDSAVSLIYTAKANKK